MAELTLKIEGMSCGHCVMAVKKALSGINGISSSDVGVGSAKVIFDESKTSREDIENAVRKAGYRVKS
ncbi:MAG: heavy-metal-associated domain-containing protein [Nitrospirae bacterium]|nr:heavy-metal-associated domain-containing protein [Nitrospirota bacterium]